MHRRLVSLAALVALVAALAAWSAGGAAGAAGGPTFTFASQNSIVTDFDPATSYSNEIIAMNNIYEQLTRYDSKTKTVKPLLATSWKRSWCGCGKNCSAQGRSASKTTSSPSAVTRCWPFA